MGGLDDTEQRPAKVDDLDLHRVGGVRPHDLSTQQTQSRRLPTLGITQHDKMRLLGEVQYDRLQFAFAETDGDLCRGSRGACRGDCAVGNLQRQERDRTRTTPGPSVGRTPPVQRRQGNHHLFPIARDTPPRPELGQLAGAPAVHLRVGRVTESELDPGADLVLQRRTRLGPPGQRR